MYKTTAGAAIKKVPKNNKKSIFLAVFFISGVIVGEKWFLVHYPLLITKKFWYSYTVMNNSIGFRAPHKKRHFPAIILVAVLVFGFALSFATGILFGFRQGALSVVPDGEKQITNLWSAGQTSEDIDFGQFWNVWNFVKSSYYEQPVSEEDLFYGSIKGMLGGLSDPYSVYFDPGEAEEFIGELDGAFEGIGAQIDVDQTGQIVIVSPLPNTPAAQAGLLAGDKILAINGEETTGFSVEEAIYKIRGPKDTEVILTITRDGWEGATEISIIRDTITINSVEMKIHEDGIAIISVYMFNEETTQLFISAVNELLVAGAKGVVLDLRGNPGGLLDSAIDIAGAWVDGEPVVIQSMRGKQQAFVGSSQARLAGLPTVVLVNGGSASASEIVTGALQDYGAATVVGTQTFGKGSVQDYQELDDGSAVKLTVAEWLTPKGRSINHVGLTPDIIVEYTQADAEADRDPQMNKAIELLK